MYIIYIIYSPLYHHLAQLYTVYSVSFKKAFVLLSDYFYFVTLLLKQISILLLVFVSVFPHCAFLSPLTKAERVGVDP